MITAPSAVRDISGRHDLAWVNIHVKQEPDHIESSKEALQLSFTTSEQREVINKAAGMDSVDEFLQVHSENSGLGALHCFPDWETNSSLQTPPNATWLAGVL